MRTKIVGISALLLLPAAAQAGIPEVNVHECSAPNGGFSAYVTIPESANDPVILRSSSGMEASFVSRGALPVGMSVEGASRAFKDALQIGDERYDVTFAPVDGGVEDFVRFPTRPSRESISYDVDVSHAAGLRLVESSLELLDAGGAPRLRVRAPFVVDAAGESQAARLIVKGCDYDTSPVAPWGRAVVAPGSDRCELIVEWGQTIGSPIQYPAVLDPAWVSGGAMVHPRNAHAAVALANGRVLVAGGFIMIATSTYSPTAEIFDPLTSTWAATASMGHGRAHTNAVLLTSGAQAGKALLATGDDLLQPSAELYDPATGLWSPTGAMVHPRDFARIAALSDGRVLAAGGCSAYSSTCDTLESSGEVYDPSTNAWTATANNMTVPRALFTLTTLGDGTTIAVGGCSLYQANFACFTTTISADIFNPATNSFTAAAPLLSAHQNHSTVELTTGEALVAGGTANGVLTHDTEVFDPTAGTWSTQGNQLFDHDEAPAVTLSSGPVLAAGTWGSSLSFNDVTANAELYVGGVWSATTAMQSTHGANTATLIGGDRVLVAGGFQSAPNFMVTESGIGEIFDVSITCGNDVVDATEQCDDGNLVSGDGCSAQCQLEVCGNSVVDFGETCDDGNTANGDGCDENCTLPGCGNGIVDAGEICDDGNVLGGDGCSTDCKSLETCGNGMIDYAVGEDCDDGNTKSGDGCSATCRQEYCGNGIIELGEVCDDGNMQAGDGCSPNCRSNETCGNGVVDPAEQCDDHNVTSGDGCSATCTTEAKDSCGDGLVQSGEACDNGAANSDTKPDACRSNCTQARCGDGVKDASEDCDLGGANADAGQCTTTCKTGPGTAADDKGCSCMLADAGEQDTTAMTLALTLVGLTLLRKRPRGQLPRYVENPKG